jgi:hypothetical protein
MPPSLITSGVTTCNGSGPDWASASSPSCWYTATASNLPVVGCITTTTSLNPYVWTTWNTDYITATTATTDWVLPTVTATAFPYTVTVSAETEIWVRWNSIQIARPEIIQTAVDSEQLNAYREQEAKRLAAVGKARTLLLEFLDEAQREQLAKSNTFELAIGDRRYRIRPGSRVERLNESGLVVSRFCIHPPHQHGLPPEDVALGQKLLLESDEAEFLRTANETRVA